MSEEKFKGRYQVEDGYVGGRPQTFVIFASWIGDDATEADLRQRYQDEAQLHFEQHIFPAIEREDEFIEWAQEVIAARKEAAA